jgi:hypothetical protein
MNNKTVRTALEQIRILVEVSLRELGSSPRDSHKKPPRVNGNTARPKNLPDWILRLRGEGFFEQPKTAKEVHEKLQSRYPCALNRVEVALLRLQKRKELRKTSKGTGKAEQVAYVW